MADISSDLNVEISLLINSSCTADASIKLMVHIRNAHLSFFETKFEYRFSLINGQARLY